MKTLIFAAALVGLISGTAANAQVVDQYCASAGGGSIRCEWATMEQCKAAFVGNKGDCTPNPKYEKKDQMKK